MKDDIYILAAEKDRVYKWLVLLLEASLLYDVHFARHVE